MPARAAPASPCFSRCPRLLPGLRSSHRYSRAPKISHAIPLSLLQILNEIP
ncbi:hypothetical protein HMPREF1980_01879 [Actinomyces sp. oral taxon 172 str. F0311]|nr:hypothetical protein HMPREF1980_01879 [Actinomyces sp. oral taxon 172 str. F0311]